MALTLSPCRYHLTKTRRLMKAYRIGRVQLPWTNLVPPIARPCNDSLVDSLTDSSSVISEAEWSDSTLNESVGDLTELKLGEPEEPEHAKIDAQNPRELQNLGVLRECTLQRRVSREEYIAEQEEKENHRDVLAYPALDCETQQAITKEYQALHERITQDGFYTCRYVEYGKDSLRFVALFAAFALTLRAEWYWTSAIFLGLFWVCCNA